MTLDRGVSFQELKYVRVELRKSPLADVYKSLAMSLLSKTASVTTTPSVLITLSVEIDEKAPVNYLIV